MEYYGNQIPEIPKNPSGKTLHFYFNKAEMAEYSAGLCRTRGFIFVLDSVSLRDIEYCSSDKMKLSGINAIVTYNPQSDDLRFPKLGPCAECGTLFYSKFCKDKCRLHGEKLELEEEDTRQFSSDYYFSCLNVGPFEEMVKQKTEPEKLEQTLAFFRDIRGRYYEEYHKKLESVLYPVARIEFEDEQMVQLYTSHRFEEPEFASVDLAKQE